MINRLPLFESEPAPPTLPKVISYWDDFSNKFHTIDDLEGDAWKIFFDGTSSYIMLPPLPQGQKLLLRAIAADLITSRSVKTALSYISSLRYTE